MKLIGRTKGIGKIYHQVAVDCDSSFGFARLYLSKKAKTFCGFLENAALPLYRDLNILLHRVLTDKGKVYLREGPEETLSLSIPGQSALIGDGNS